VVIDNVRCWVVIHIHDAASPSFVDQWEVYLFSSEYIYIYIYIYRHICVFKNILLEHNKNVLTYDVLYNRLYKIIYHNVDSSSSK
jgi:hypothetical protein